MKIKHLVLLFLVNWSSDANASAHTTQKDNAQLSKTQVSLSDMTKLLQVVVGQLNLSTELPHRTNRNTRISSDSIVTSQVEFVDKKIVKSDYFNTVIFKYIEIIQKQNYSHERVT